ncbi:MAG: glycogen/starch synthase [Chitinophagales bacterium]|nr:glycogen/starch synthase [Chitinophagales bacterium]
MEKTKVLIVANDLMPFTQNSEYLSKLLSTQPSLLMSNNCDIRILMPKFGFINDRKHRLNQVSRLSGLNVSFGGEDYSLTIKVSSLQINKNRVQVYFLYNDDFFERKSLFHDESGDFYSDNVERMVFYNRGVVETVKKFGWAPDMIICNGWFSSLVPLYIKSSFHKDPVFMKTKIVFQNIDDQFASYDHKKFKELISLDGHIPNKHLAIYDTCSHECIVRSAMHYSDIVLNYIDEQKDQIEKICKENTKPLFHIFDELDEQNNFLKILGFTPQVA